MESNKKFCYDDLDNKYIGNALLFKYEALDKKEDDLLNLRYKLVHDLIRRNLDLREDTGNRFFGLVNIKDNLNSKIDDLILKISEVNDKFRSLNREKEIYYNLLLKSGTIDGWDYLTPDKFVFYKEKDIKQWEHYYWVYIEQTKQLNEQELREMLYARPKQKY